MRLHTAHLSFAKAAALMAALGGPAAAQETVSSPLLAGLAQAASNPTGTMAADADLCSVVHPGAFPTVWSSQTPEAASVFLLVQGRNGEPWSVGATGTIIQGSDTGHGARVLTSAHVFHDTMAGRAPEQVWAFGADGTPLARLTMREMGTFDGITRDTGPGSIRQDLAVLEPTVFMETDRDAWNGRAAPLAASVHRDALILEQPDGGSRIAFGASGGAVFDAAGAVAGVLSFGRSEIDATRTGQKSPFLDSMAKERTGDRAIDGWVRNQRMVAAMDGTKASPGGVAVAVAVVGAARAALGAETPMFAEPAPFNARMAAFPWTECRMGPVLATPHVEPARTQDVVLTGGPTDPTAKPNTPDVLDAKGAWKALQSTGWYPEGLKSRAVWQVLQEEARLQKPIPLEPVQGLLAQAVLDKGVVGAEARGIARALEEHVRTGRAPDGPKLPVFTFQNNAAERD